MSSIFGRAQEQAILRRALQSRDAEFVAVYGRRRVGKTFLIREFFETQTPVFFEFTGMKDAPLLTQLNLFLLQLSKTFDPTPTPKKLTNWSDAFELLSETIQSVVQEKTVVIFLDELPWMSTKRSGLVQALDYYWNTQWSRWSNFKLVVCGSAASWMLDKLIHDKGGLYQRLTQKIHLPPFNLKESQAFLEHRNIHLTTSQTLELYFAIGGVPLYLKQVNRGETASQNIARICFQQNGFLVNEFEQLFQSLFSKSHIHQSIIRAIASQRYGVSREELAHRTGLPAGGSLQRPLKELEAAGFIHPFIPYGHKKKDLAYKVIDEYTLFYLKWMEPLKSHQKFSSGEREWEGIRSSTSWSSWAGYTFEMICWKHMDAIRKALGIQQTPCVVGHWSTKAGAFQQQGAQIDLLFDRQDNAISICEIKYNKTPFVIDKNYAQKLMNKVQQFQNIFPSSKQHFLVMITSGGLKDNLWAQELVDTHISLDHLFTSG